MCRPKDSLNISNNLFNNYERVQQVSQGSNLMLGGREQTTCVRKGSVRLTRVSLGGTFCMIEEGVGQYKIRNDSRIIQGMG